MRRSAGLAGAALMLAACTSARVAHSPARLTARIVLDVTSEHAGRPVHGHLVLTNDTGKRIAYCNGVARIGLTKPGVPFEPIEPASGCAVAGEPTIPTGTSRWPITVRTRYEACTASGATAALPLCAAGPSGGTVIPPLPAGSYHTVVVWHLERALHPTVAGVAVELTH